MSDPDLTEADLHAYVDDELDATRRAAVERLLTEQPRVAARVAAYQADRDQLRRALEGAAERADSNLVALIEQSTAPRAAAWQSRLRAATRFGGPLLTTLPTRRMAIAAGLAAVASSAGVADWRWPGQDSILVAAETARNGTQDEANKAGAGSGEALLRTKTGLSVRAPDLRHFGFQLARLELFGQDGHGAAQLRYRDDRQHLLTIYVRRSDGTVRFDLLRHGPNRVCVWQDDVVGAVIIAPISAGEMMRVASSAYTALNL